MCLKVKFNIFESSNFYSFKDLVKIVNKQPLKYEISYKHFSAQKHTF